MKYRLYNNLSKSIPKFLALFFASELSPPAFDFSSSFRLAIISLNLASWLCRLENSSSSSSSSLLLLLLAPSSSSDNFDLCPCNNCASDRRVDADDDDFTLSDFDGGGVVVAGGGGLIFTSPAFFLFPIVSSWSVNRGETVRCVFLFPIVSSWSFNRGETARCGGDGVGAIDGVAVVNGVDID